MIHSNVQTLHLQLCYDTSCQNPTPSVPTNASQINQCNPCANGYYADNYDPLATVSNGSCTGPSGCTNWVATNYNRHAYIDDGSCTYNCCGSSFVINGQGELVLTLGPGNTCAQNIGDYELTITQPDCQVYNDGTTNWMNQTGTISGSNTFSLTIGMAAIQAAAQAGTTGCPSGALHAGSWTAYVNYSMPLTLQGAAPTNCNSGYIVQTVTPGCTDDTTGTNPDVNGNCKGTNPANCTGLGCCGAGNGYLAEQYDPAATVNDGTCTYPVFGCTDSGTRNPSYVNQTGDINSTSCASCAENYDPNATVNDGSCEYWGCINPVTLTGAVASNAYAYLTHDCSGNNPSPSNPSNQDSSCCTYGTTGCIVDTTGCHPSISQIPHSIASGLLSSPYTGPIGIGTPCFQGTGGNNCGTCLDGTTCSTPGCCGAGNGFTHDNYDPICHALSQTPLSTACAGCTNNSCCSTPTVTGCATSAQPVTFPTPGCASVTGSNTFTIGSVLHDACVTDHDKTLCIPEVEGCMDPLAMNFGSYKPASAFGPFRSNTFFGLGAPRGCLAATHQQTHNYTQVTSATLMNPTIPESRNGRNGPNSGGPANCGGVNNPCNHCVYPVYGCMDNGTNPNFPGRPSNYPSGVHAINYDQAATVNQVSANNTTSPCCYDNGCILPNYFAVTSPSQQMNTAVNIGSTGCNDYINGVSGSSVNDCYGGMIDVSSEKIDGTADGSTVGNGLQLGNDDVPVALNGGGQCGTCQTPGSSPGPIEVGRFQNTDGYLDPGGYGNNNANTALVGSSTLTSNWSTLASSGGIACCDYYDGCSDPCAMNFNPNANTSPNAQTCTFGSIPFSPTNQPPWQSLHPCSTATPPVQSS